MLEIFVQNIGFEFVKEPCSILFGDGYISGSFLESFEDLLGILSGVEEQACNDEEGIGLGFINVQNHLSDLQ